MEWKGGGTYSAALDDSLEMEERLEPFLRADVIRFIIFETPSCLSSLERLGWLDIFNSFAG